MSEWQWHEVSTDGRPPVDGETVYIGVNVNGHVCAFNDMSEDRCFSVTPEDATELMSGLKYWAPYVSPILPLRFRTLLYMTHQPTAPISASHVPLSSGPAECKDSSHPPAESLATLDEAINEHMRLALELACNHERLIAQGKEAISDNTDACISALAAVEASARRLAALTVTPRGGDST